MIQDILRQLLYLIAVEWNQLISHLGYDLHWVNSSPVFVFFIIFYSDWCGRSAFIFIRSSGQRLCELLGSLRIHYPSVIFCKTAQPNRTKLGRDLVYNYFIRPCVDSNLAFTEHNLLLQQHHNSLFFCANFPCMQGSTLTFWPTCPFGQVPYWFYLPETVNY
jgi:hypothetical protein